MQSAEKRYLREFLSAMLAYAVVVMGTSWLLERMGGSPWRWLIAVAPVIPIAFALVAFLRFLNRMDELQRRIQLNAIGFAAGATGMVTLTLGFLESAGLPCLSWVWIFPMLIAFWGVATFVVSRRYA